ncbi:phosphatase PAP2 family protein [Rudanella paleaurantiibacter]|uniref:Phosphatase PAP2 family protein n=2 Tax=Rudanella paleaurantiibacter TaxID=2614655 RepID=A0A7J5TVL1_9BACT|nr:phosphatase PAP2 family protein [Rudanella paleaurantiibacter]
MNLMAQPLVPRDSVYQLQTGREIRLLALGLAANGAALLIGQGQSGLTEAQIAQLDPQSINAFDRGATRNWSPKAARLSDLTLLGTVGVVGLTGLPTLRQKKWFTVPLLYAQTMLLTLGTVDIVKEVALRNRPFVYHAAAPLSEKMDRDARRAFFSGHASVSFASAVFASTVFGHYFPVSKLKPVVWVGSLGLATTTALLRYEAGKHFPTDLLVGAAVGSAAGWLVPRLHRPRAGSKAYSMRVTPWTNGVANGVYVQVALP